MSEQELKDYMKQVSENEDSAIKLLQENVELKKRFKEISKFIRKHIYSITNDKERTNRLDLTNEEYDELMKLVERN